MIAMKNVLTHISKRKLLGWLAAVLLVGIAVIILAFSQARGSGGELEYATLVKGTLIQTVEAPGNARARQSAELTWKTTGIVGEVAIHTGQPVESGQALINLEKNHYLPV